MHVTYRSCAGLDVHKKTVVACRRRITADGVLEQETRTFGTFTNQLLDLVEWLSEWECSHCAMESTGEYWQPVHTLLEGQLEVLLVNAHHVKAVPGRKTDVRDAAWLADLLQHGLLRGSFIPPRPQRDLRDLTRQRTNLAQARVTVINQLQKVCEGANLKLASIASDVTGVSARAILAAIIEGNENSAQLAEFARGRMRSKRAELAEALVSRVRDHHRFLLTNHLAHIDCLDEQIAMFDAEIDAHIQATRPVETTADAETPIEGVAQPEESVDRPVAWADAIALLDSAPGINTRLAHAIVAEIGTNMTRFPSAAHLAAWAGLAPGNNESAGKQRSSHIPHGERPIRRCLVQAAHAAARSKKTYLGALYARLVVRRGRQRAIIAVAHSLLRSIYFMLSRHEEYHDLGYSYFDERKRDSVAAALTRRLERLGYHVALEPKPSPAPAA